MIKFDTRAFSQHVPRSEVADFLSRHQDANWRLFGDSKKNSTANDSQPIFNYSLILTLMIAIVYAVNSIATHGYLDINIIFMAGILTITYFIAKIGTQIHQRTGVVYERFAMQNGLTYRYHSKQVPDYGAIFGIGDSREMRHIVSGQNFEFGNYSYKTGSGKSRATHTWGYLCVTLDRAMPHILLDAKVNNSRLFGQEVSSNLPYGHDTAQLVRLEGDFNEHFNIYAPKGYETDVFYVFTPDLMALLIDHGANCDIEVVGDKLYVYLPQMFTQSVAGVEYIEQLLHVLIPKLQDRTTRYTRHTEVFRALSAPALRRTPSYVSAILIVVCVLLAFSLAIDRG
jgi:hypothetical protein